MAKQIGVETLTLKDAKRINIPTAEVQSVMADEEKANTMHAYWVLGVNNLGKFGRWDFTEFTAVYEIEKKFAELVEGFVAGKAA